MSERAASKERGAQGLDLSPIRKRYHGCLAEVDQMEFYCRLQQCVADIPALLAEVDRLRTQGSAPSGPATDAERELQASLTMALLERAAGDSGPDASERELREFQTIQHTVALHVGGMVTLENAMASIRAAALRSGGAPAGPSK
jgi:hypothetical protein